VWEALADLQVTRIDHGNRALEDEALVARMASENTCLTVCPLSNLKLCVIERIEDHPIRDMLNAGLLAMINSDDPSYFGGYVNANYHAVINALDLTRSEIETLLRNSFIGSFMDDSDKAEALAKLDAYVTQARFAK